MNILNRLTAIILLVIGLGIAAIVFSMNFVKSSLPGDYEEIQFEALDSEVKIYRNEHRIPHIIALTEHDLFFAIGYCHAQDRLWQMDLTRRAVYGKLSEIFGEKTLLADKFMRVFEIRKIANKLYHKSSKKTKSILNAYSDGVNAFIEEHRSNLSFEFGTLDYLPSKWLPEDCLAIGRGMTIELSPAITADAIFGEIAQKLGYEKTINLIPSYSAADPVVLDENLSVQNNKLMTQSLIESKIDLRFGDFTKQLISSRALIGYEGTSAGSNSWAISNKSQKKSILSNDVHLSLSLPARFYQIHISAPGINTVGLGIPGIPLPLAGRNNDIAWGLTNIMLDDFDYYVESLSGEDNSFYLDAEHGKLKIEYQPDTIAIKGKENHIYYIRKTRTSNIISDFHLLKDMKWAFCTNSTSHYYSKNVLTYNSTINSISDEVLALYKVNIAESWSEFTKALSSWATPALNYTYADKIGNIGIYPAGAVPERNPNYNPIFPAQNSISMAWTRTKPTGSLPVIYNPQRSFVFSANNKLTNRTDYYISSYWEPSSRAIRIEEMLTTSVGNHTIRDSQIMQYDQLSPYIRKMLEYVIPILDKYRKALSKSESQALDKLKSWDYIISADSYLAAVMNIFIDRLITNTFKDELGELLFHKYCYNSSIPYRRILEILNEPDNKLFDKVNTKDIESKEYIITLSFKECLKEYERHSVNKRIDRPVWGDFHKLNLRHPFSSHAFLSPTVSADEIAVGGNLTTINNSEWKIYRKYEMVLGPSMRLICDMNDSIIYSNIPGGSSGDPLSPNYADQLQLWLRGGYVKQSINPNNSGKDKLSTVLKPK